MSLVDDAGYRSDAHHGNGGIDQADDGHQDDESPPTRWMVGIISMMKMPVGSTGVVVLGLLHSRDDVQEAV